MKKLIAIALVLMLAFPVGALAEMEIPDDAGIGVGAEAADAAASETPELVQRDMESLKIGTVTPLSGDFFTDMWGNNTTDIDVRALIHGYATVGYNADGNYDLDKTVLKDTVVTDGELGRTYAFTLNPGLKYSDGTPITAADYVFSALLISDPRMTDLGSVPGALEQLVGFDEYVEGVRAGDSGAVFSGVRLIADDQFSLTIQKDRLPYFYELALACVQPYPRHVIAPESEVVDDGAGAYLSGAFSAELLEETVLNPETGYRFHPAVCAGPYTLVSFDGESRVAELQINPEYLGNFEGKKPEIQKLTLLPADQATMVSQLQNGELDVLHKVSSGERINEAMELSKSGEAGMQSYLRAGLSFLGFACEQGATQSLAVRQAIAMCVDEQSLVEEFLKGYGLVSYGYYGYGQWMAEGNDEMLLSLARYAFNPNAAVGLLEADGWTLNEDGTEYDDELGGVRFRKAADGAMEKLSIRWAFAPNSDAIAYLKPMLETNMAAAGFELIATELSFDQLLRNYYRQDARAYEMFFMATNFQLTFDPYYTFSSGMDGVHNTSGIRDEQLMQLADYMRRTAPDDKEGYLAKWNAFQQRFVEVLPAMPLYSNVYFDFYRPDLQDYNPNAKWSIGQALLYAHFGAPQTAEAGSEATAG